MTPVHFPFSSSFMLVLAALAFHRYHLLSALLCQEGLMLSLFVALSLSTHQLDSSSFSASPMHLLGFSACEARAGLALLVATGRTHGSDRLQSLNLLQC
uniref:NADH-ubiquinone oxidoreductase chain 4L n=1 Tax=Selaroides leptolepis TaxID=173311 RepID=A0A120L0Z7_SELLE|nr:NADH dehydrogenase subunit 4L [Selaroides leptolepis]